MARLSIEAGKGPTAGWSSACCLRFRGRCPCCPTSTSRPASASASWRSRGRLRRRRPGCGRARRRRTGSGSRPCRRPSRPVRRPVRRGRRPLSAARAGSCLRGSGKSLFGGAGRLSALLAEPPRWSRSSRSRRRSRRPARRRRAGRRGPGQGEGRRASAPCYSDRAPRPVRRGAPSVRQIGCAAASKQEEMEMAERAALVTGASSGIGLAIARTLGEEGYALTVSARRPEKLEEAAAGLSADGFEVQTVAANMTDEDDVARRLRRPPRQVRPPRRPGQQRRGRDRGADGGNPDQAPRHAARGQPAGADPRHPRGPAAAARGRRRARQGADRQHRLDRRQRRPGLALDLRRDQGRGDQLHAVDPPRGGRRRDPVHGAGAGLRRHRDDRVRQGPGPGRGR